MTIKEDYEKILKGCGNAFCGYSPKWGTKTGYSLCPSCSAKKEVFLERCKDELNFLNKLFENGGLTDFSTYPFVFGIPNILLYVTFPVVVETIERISQLKEVLEIK